MRFIAVATAAFALAGFATSALAQDLTPPVVGVMQRERPDYDAKGVDVGGFRLKPALDVGANYDDNVYRTDAAARSDYFFNIAPSLTLKSQWSRHMLEVTAGLTRYEYTDLTKEDRTDWNAGADGRFDVWHGSAINWGSDYAVLHEPRYSPDQPGSAARPTEYSLFHNEASAVYQPYRLGLEVGGNFDRYNYHDTPLVGGGVLNNDDRDHDTYGGYAQISYRVGGDTAVFIRGSYDTRDFSRKIDRNGVNRDSHGYRADGGVRLFLTHLIEGEIFGGYGRQSFKAPLKSISTFDYGVQLNWYATELMTFHLTASRTLNDTTIAGASVTDDQSFGASLDYELLRDLILQTGVDYTLSDFVGIPRHDKYLQASFNAKYLINRYLSANAGYQFSQRHSNAASQAFSDNTVQLGLKFQI